MVDESQARYERGETFGAAQAQKYLTFLRASKTDKDGGKWLAAHSCVPQQQIVRDYSQSRGKAVSDRKTSSRKRKAGMPRHKSRKTALPSLNYRIGGFTLVEQDGKTRLKLPKGMIIPVVWSRELPSRPKSVRVLQVARRTLVRLVRGRDGTETSPGNGARGRYGLGCQNHRLHGRIESFDGRGFRSLPGRFPPHGIRKGAPPPSGETATTHGAQT